MAEYWFDFEEHRSDNHAEMDPIGGAVRVYLQTFLAHNILPNVSPLNAEDLTITTMIAVLIHEDLHVEIGKEADLTGEQEHSTVYEWVYNWLIDNTGKKDSLGD